MSEAIHVHPLDDAIDHELEGDGCVCGPDSEAVFDDDGSVAGWVIVHHSLDGRELTEVEP